MATRALAVSHVPFNRIAGAIMAARTRATRDIVIPSDFPHSHRLGNAALSGPSSVASPDRRSLAGSLMAR